MKRVLSLMGALLGFINISAQEAVDLGLSVKWANMNIGASNIYDVGEYFAWGETETKGKYDFDWDTYFDAEKKYNGLTVMKLFNSNRYSSIKGHKSYDVAAKRLGGYWRMPTPEECRELARNCTIQLIHDKKRDSYYWEIKGKNGNSIIMPNTGWMGINGHTGGGVYFWTTKLDEQNDSRAYSAQFDSRLVYKPWAVQPEKRCSGLTIRPVYDGIEEIATSDNAIEQKWGEAMKYIKASNESSHPNDQYIYLNRADKILKALEISPGVEKVIDLEKLRRYRDSIRKALSQLEDI